MVGLFWVVSSCSVSFSRPLEGETWALRLEREEEPVAGLFLVCLVDDKLELHLLIASLVTEVAFQAFPEENWVEMACLETEKELPF